MNQRTVPNLGVPPSHTAHEIAQQPALWRQVDADPATESARAFAQELLTGHAPRVVLTGAGTSGYVGQIVAAELARGWGGRVDAVASTDIVATPRDAFVEDVPTLVVSFARSGDSPESVAATTLADQCLTEVHHLVITCNSDGQLARQHQGRPRSQVLILPDGSNDQGFAMTSSFTSMAVAALAALSRHRPTGLGEQLASAAELLLREVPEQAREVMSHGPRRLVYLGSGALAGLARESALKVLELTAGRINAMGETPLAFRHGPKAVLTDHTLVVLYLSNDPYTRAYDQDLLAELRASEGGHEVLAVTADHEDLPEGAPTWILPTAKRFPDSLLAVPAVICAQLLGLHASLGLGLDVDNPFPAGEVNRVVNGVTIYPLPPSAE